MFAQCEPREHDLCEPLRLVAVTDGPRARAKTARNSDADVYLLYRASKEAKRKSGSVSHRRGGSDGAAKNRTIHARCILPGH